MGCGQKAASEYHDDVETLGEKVKGIKILQDMIDEYRIMSESNNSLWALINGRDGDYIRELVKLWDDPELEENEHLTMEILTKRKKDSIVFYENLVEMRKLSKKFKEAVGYVGKAGIEDCI